MRNKKRSDFRFTAPDGSEWDSKFEWQVTEGIKDAGYKVRRCVKGDDTIPYVHLVPRASCQDCGSSRVGSERGITPDLYFDSGYPFGQKDRGYLEVKGYMRAPKRALYRSLFKEKQNLDLCFVIQSNFRVGKGYFGQWLTKYLRIPWAIWKGNWETLEWNLPDERSSKMETKKSRKSKATDKAKPKKTTS